MKIKGRHIFLQGHYHENYSHFPTITHNKQLCINSFKPGVPFMGHGHTE